MDIDEVDPALREATRKLPVPDAPRTLGEPAQALMTRARVWLERVFTESDRRGR